MRNTIELEFADGEYTFALPIPRINELETKCGTPEKPGAIGDIFGRLLSSCTVDPVSGRMMLVPQDAKFRAIEIIETVRQGLIGGNHGIVNGEEIKVTPALATRLIDSYVLTRPLGDSLTLAASILLACVVGYDPPKKVEPADEPAHPEPMDA